MRNKLIFTGLTIALLVLIYVFNFKDRYIPIPTPIPINVKSGVLTIPAVKNTREMDPFLLPDSLKIFIISEALDPKFYNVEYENSQLGYEIQFIVPASLFDVYLRYNILRREYLMLKGARSTLSAVYDLENDKIWARILMSYIDDRNTRVEIFSVDKL